MGPPRSTVPVANLTTQKAVATLLPDASAD